MRLRPNTTVSQIRRKIGKSARERKRTSEKRRRRLEKHGRWISGRDMEVQFQRKGASCQPHPGSRDFLVKIPTDEHDQPETDLDPEVWDFVFQKAELIHELGHVLYTDFDTMKEYADRAEDEHGVHGLRLFKQLQNINEDGAIERQLAAAYNVGNDLQIKNANLLQSGEPGVTDGHQQVHKLHHGIESFLMDTSKYDTGRAAQLLDPADDGYVFEDDDLRERMVELLPMLKQMSEDIVTEPDPAERIRITYDYFEKLIDEIEDVGEITEDPLDWLSQLFPDDANVYVVKPGGEPPDDAEALDPDEDDVVIVLDPDEAQQYAQSVDADDEDDENTDDVEAWQRAVEATGHRMYTENTGDVDAATWAKAQQYASRFEKELRRVLQQQRASATDVNQRAGRPDVQALWKLGYGESRVFQNERKPEEKTYSAVLLLDRSGSMGGDLPAPWIIDEAEAVTTALSMALEAVGVETAIVAVAKDATLEKPFGVPTEQRKHVLCRNHSDGGTHLGKALALAKERLRQRQDSPLVFAVTDGEPSDDDRYEDELRSATFPVVGAYFGPERADPSDVRGYYHRIVTSDKDDLDRNVEGLIKRLVV